MRLRSSPTDEKAGKTTLYRRRRTASRSAGRVDLRRRQHAALFARRRAHRAAGDGGRAQEDRRHRSRRARRWARSAQAKTNSASRSLPASGGALKLVSPADTYIYEYRLDAGRQGLRRHRRQGQWRQQLVDRHARLRRCRKRRDARDRRAQDADRTAARLAATARRVAFIGGLMSDWGSIGGDVYTVPLAGGAPIDLTPNLQGHVRRHRLARRRRSMASALIGRPQRRRDASIRHRKRVTASLVGAGHRVAARTSTVRSPSAPTARSPPRSSQDFTHAPEIALRPAAGAGAGDARQCGAGPPTSRRKACTGRTKASTCRAGCSGRRKSRPASIR